MRVLGVGAHPDDLELFCAGTLAKYAKKGDEVVMAVVTNGEVGSSTLSKEEIAKIRKEEAKAAASIIGAKLVWMNFPDEFLFDNKKSRLEFINMIRQARPDIIFTHFPGDYHPDHRITGEIIRDIQGMVTIPNIKTKFMPCDKIPEIYFMDITDRVNFLPEKYVNITKTFNIKKKMLAEHKSQSTWLKNRRGIDYLEFIELGARLRGIEAGVFYAEGFQKVKAWPRYITKQLP